MVDFKPEEIDLYLPHNLSNEDYHEKVQQATTVFERLKLQQSSAVSRQVHASSTCRPHLQRTTMEEGRSHTCPAAHQVASSSSTSSSPPQDKDITNHPHKQQQQTKVLCSAESGHCNGVSPQTPDDIRFFLPVGSSVNAGDVVDDPVAESPTSLVSDPDMAEGSHREASQTDLTTYLKDLSVSSPVAGSESGDTVFSDDYTAMTDIGEGSELGDSNLDSSDELRRLSAASSDADSATGSDKSSLTTLESDDSLLKLAACPGNTSSPLLPNKHRPDIKLLLSQPNPVDLEDWEDTPSCSKETTPESPEKEMPVVNETNFYEDREFDFLRTEPVKRSTSLKTYKTPPGTPHRKKAVRFADALGLDLESVRHILNLEEPPKVPASAMRDLHTHNDDENGQQHKVVDGLKYLSLNFPQPGASPTFFQRVQGQKVLLENCVVDDKNLSITGTVRVANISYHKKVVVRYTVNNWLTYTDVPASYVQNSNDGPTDRFSFSFSVPDYFSVGSRLQFCIQFVGGGAEFWDSNYGGNYVAECYAKTTSMNESDNAWLHFL